MWQRLGKFVLAYRLSLLFLLLAATAVMGYYAGKVKLSYEFARAIPTDNPKYRSYLAFKKQFGFASHRLSKIVVEIRKQPVIGNDG